MQLLQMVKRRTMYEAMALKSASSNLLGLLLCSYMYRYSIGSCGGGDVGGDVEFGRAAPGEGTAFFVEVAISNEWETTSFGLVWADRLTSSAGGGWMMEAIGGQRRTRALEGGRRKRS